MKMLSSHSNSRSSKESSAGRARARTRASSSPPPRSILAPGPSRLVHGRPPSGRSQTPGRGRRPNTPRVLRPLPWSGLSRLERAFGVPGRSGLRARPVCTPGQVGRRWLPINSRARGVPQHPQKSGPQFLATKHTRGLWPSLDLAFGAGFFNAENAAKIGRLLRFWESLRAGTLVRVGQTQAGTKRRYHRCWPRHAAYQNRPRRQRERLRSQGREAPQGHIQ